ncbi:hypothetical protein BKA83DRAFT_4496820 [Pisolithus microcarpus]|nr:hypothetical protein BKA83DRAFT_4496820 [Pisolithus microcarpus]
MSEQQQCKVRFCRQVDIVPISPQQQPGTSSVHDEEIDTSSSQSRTVSKNCPSMEVLNLYGEESPSLPTEMSTALRSPSPTCDLSLFERMKCAHVPKPPTPEYTRAPSPQADLAMADAEDLGHIAVRTPSPTPNLSLFERMKRAPVPSPPSLTEERVPSSQEDAEMELAESSGDTTARSPSALLNLSLFERMKRAPVPKPPSPVPASDVDLFNRMRHARVPSPPSPAAAAEVDAMQTLQSAEAPPPPSQFEGLQIEQGDDPDRSRRIDFGDPDRTRLRELFTLGLTGPPLSVDECRALERAGLAKADTAEDVLRVLHDFKSRHVGPVSAGNYPYERTLDLYIVRAMKRIGADIQQLVENRVKTMHLGHYMIDSIDLLELSRYPHTAHNIQPYTGGPPYPTRQSAIEMAIIYWGLRIECAVVHLLGLPRVSDWPTHWFYNLLLDLKELDHLILVTVSRHSFTPMLPVCFHAYLRCQQDKDRFLEEIRKIPPGAFHMIDSLANYIPDWTSRTPNKYIGFVFPWWLHGSSHYPTDFQQLRGGRIFPIAAEYFQYKWPAANPSMGDQIDNWIAGQVQNQMKYVREIEEDIEVNGRNVNHLFSRWAALSGLLGMEDIA